MIVTQGIFVLTLSNYPLVTLKDLVQFGQYLSFMFSTWPLVYVTIYRSQALKQLYIKFYDLSENSFYSETNYHSVSVFCKFLAFLSILILIEQIYTAFSNLPNIGLYELLSFFVIVWIIIVYNYCLFLIDTYIFLLSLYISEINQFLDKNFIKRKFLRTLIDIYTKSRELAEDLNSIFDIFLLLAPLCQFFWIMWVTYSKIYILVEIGFISVNESFELIRNIILSMIFTCPLLWACSKTKNTVSVYLQYCVGGSLAPLGAHRLCIQNLVEFGTRAKIFIF